MSTPVRLHAHARPLRRGDGEVQFGLCPEGGVVLAGLNGAEVDLLLELRSPVSSALLTARGRRQGVDAARMAELLGALDRSGLLVRPMPLDRSPVPPQPGAEVGPWAVRAAVLASAYRLPGDGVEQLAARAAREVLVLGRGELADQVAGHLSRSGVGRLVREAEGSRPDLVVLVTRTVLPERHGEHWRDAGVPHLPVVVRQHTVLLGPLVRPGQGPCLRCLDLHRGDRDRAWPRLLSQLAGEQSRDVTTDPVLAAVGAGLTSMVTQAHLDGAGVPAGRSWQIGLPWPEITSRRWVRHPRCDCPETERPTATAG